MTIATEPTMPLHRPERMAPAVPSAARLEIAEKNSISDLLFRSTAAAPFWLVVRLWLGYEWLSAGWEKLHATGQASWFGHAPALAGFVHGADAAWANRANAFGHPAVHYAWFLNFLHFVGSHGSIFGPVVVLSEILVGVGLLTGTLTRWAALGGVLLNVMYICGGSAGVNGVFLLAGVLLMIASNVAGHLGGDRVLRDLRDRRQPVH